MPRHAPCRPLPSLLCLHFYTVQRLSLLPSMCVAKCSTCQRASPILGNLQESWPRFIMRTYVSQRFRVVWQPVRALDTVSMRYCESNNPLLFHWFHKMYRQWNSRSLVPSVSVKRVYSLAQSSSIDLSLKLPWGIVRYFHPAWPVSAMCSAKSLFLMFATIFALISPLINGAVIEKRHFVLLDNPGFIFGLSPPNDTSSFNVSRPRVVAQAVTAATPEIAATSATSASLAIPVTSLAASQITSGPVSSCAWATCNLFYPVSDPSTIPNTMQK